MPKIKSYTPGWLAKGSPGHNLFAPSTDASRASLSSPYSAKTKKKSPNGARRTIARRGTEVFVANGREIRWGDLVYLKEKYASKRAGARVKREYSDDDTLESIESENRAAGYRVSCCTPTPLFPASCLPALASFVLGHRSTVCLARYLRHPPPPFANCRHCRSLQPRWPTISSN